MPFRPRAPTPCLCVLMAFCVVFPRNSYLVLNSPSSSLKELQVRSATLQKATNCPRVLHSTPAGSRLSLWSSDWHHCLALGPAGLVVGSSDAAYVGDGTEVIVPLTKVQGEQYETIGRVSLHKRIAFVMFGQVIADPIVQSSLTSPVIAIYVTNRRLASQVVATLKSNGK
jgi:hypothetical protein